MSASITAQQAFSIFMEINAAPVNSPYDVYFTALDAERWGHITVSEMDAIAVYHKAEIVTMYAEHIAAEKAEIEEMARVHAAQEQFWLDTEFDDNELH